MSIDVVILAGGRGERFWPLSRAARPKQLLALVDDRSLLQATWARARRGVGADRVWAIAPRDLAPVLVPEVPEISAGRWIWETTGRNTGPAVAAAVAVILAEGARAAEDGDRQILVLPADHWIPDAEAFWRAVRAGVEVVVGTGRLVTFGIRATRAETGYGYIERGAALPLAVAGQAHEVLRFHEKPERAAAAAYLESGRFYWNAGIFLFSAAGMAREITQHAPEIAAPFAELRARLAALPPGEWSAAWTAYFRDCTAISIDQAVLERSRAVAVVEAPFTWDDLGSWSSWGEHRAPDTAGNRTAGAVLAFDAHDNIVHSEVGGLVALLGVDGLVVVRTGDVTLVCPRDRVQEIRELVRRGQGEGLPWF